MDAAKPLTPNVVAELVNNHRRFLSFLRSWVGNLSDAEDILQAAFVKAVRKSNSIRESESVVAWFFRLLRNAVIDYDRHQDAEGRALDRLAEMNIETDATVRDFERAICRCVRP